MSQPTIVPVALPNEIDGVPLSWEPWDLAPIMSHIPYDCEHCAFDGEPATALATSTEQRGRWTAVRCRRCQATTVTTFQPEAGRLGRYVRVWSAPPQPWTAEVSA
ncbi:hypothetical protein ACN27B_08595 [Micromonospora sp. WMMD754]|uniref:hypothetical protein n=1 Tax=Micromonospora sp. WMMD754 TaxID=3404114 RepID=UPI003BF47AE1